MLERLDDLAAAVPPIDWALAVAVGVSLVLAAIVGRRGGRFRGLAGWGGFWVIFAGLLVCLSRAQPWVSFPLLAAMMFAALRSYFFVAPVRRGDRYAILASYFAIPFALWPAYMGSYETFLATVPVALFLFIPAILAVGSVEKGLLDSMGRTLLGVLFFVFCIAYLGLLVHEKPKGLLELFGVLVLAAELPRRLIGGGPSGAGWVRRISGILLGLALATAMGYWLAPWCGLVEEDSARAGFLVALAVAMGAAVGDAVTKDLALAAKSSLYGRGTILNRTVPAVYAAPVFFHYLNHFT